MALAKTALEMFVSSGTVIDIPELLPWDMSKRRAGVFVSIKKSGRLRGCIGTITPTKSNLAEEIIHNSISSGTEDPKYNPVELLELDNLIYSVDVVDKPEKIETIRELDVKKYGIIVRSGRRTGLLLPDLQGIDTTEKQLSIALLKAGISSNESYTMERFATKRYK